MKQSGVGFYPSHVSILYDMKFLAILPGVE
jgi:hypothetical protein